MLNVDTHAENTMFAVEEGSFEYEIGNNRGEAKFGDLVLCPSGIPFRRHMKQPLTFHFISFHWIVDQPSESLSFPEGKITFADTKRLTSTYQYLRLCQYNPSHLNHYLKDLWQQHALERDSFGDMERQASDDPPMNTAIRYIQENACQTIHFGSLAEMLGMTPVQFTRRFRSVFGRTPSDYVTELRLRKACRLLEETSLSLEQIAGQCGYENGFYFSRIFTRKKAVNPSQYRKAHQV